MTVRSALLNVMIRAVEKTGKALIRDFGELEQLQVSRKGPSDFVSAADLKAEKLLVAELEKVRPDFGFLLEEGGAKTGADASSRWIIDPLDGTTNFLHGLPHWAISVAAEKNNEIIAGVIYDPIKDEMFWAEKGGGAFMNARRLRVSGRIKLDECLLATGIPFRGSGHHAGFSKELAMVMPMVAGVRRFGAAALDLAYVAAGRYDGYWESGIQPWDVAAGSLLVTEAGGKVQTIAGGKANPVYDGSILAGSATMVREVGALLQSAHTGKIGDETISRVAGS